MVSPCASSGTDPFVVPIDDFPRDYFNLSLFWSHDDIDTATFCDIDSFIIIWYRKKCI